MYTSQRVKFYFGHLFQLLLYAVILSKGKCICKESAQQALNQTSFGLLTEYCLHSAYKGP